MADTSDFMEPGRFRKKEGRNRGPFEITASMLTLMPCKKTHIMYMANLSFQQVMTYLDILIAKGFATYSPDDRLYRKTLRGDGFLKAFEELVSYIDPGWMEKFKAGGKHPYIDWG